MVHPFAIVKLSHTTVFRVVTRTAFLTGNTDPLRIHYSRDGNHGTVLNLLLNHFRKRRRVGLKCACAGFVAESAGVKLRDALAANAVISIFAYWNKDGLEASASARFADM